MAQALGMRPDTTGLYEQGLADFDFIFNTVPAPVLPVRVSADIPKDRIFDVMDALKTVTVSERIGRGDVVIPDVLGLGVDVIATSSLLRHRPE